MNNSTYLIPANTKAGSLIFSLFTKFDITLLSVGVGVSSLMIIIIPLNNLLITILALAPGLISGFLVMPIPNYHNVITVLNGALRFYTDRRMFIWKGWCVSEYVRSEKE